MNDYSPRTGLAALPGFDDMSQHALVDWALQHEEHVFGAVPDAGDGLNPSLAGLALRARALGIEDEGALTELLTALAVNHGRDPDTAAGEAARAAKRSADGFTSSSGSTKPAAIPPETRIRNATKVLNGSSKEWVSPAPVPEDPAAQLAEVLTRWYEPTDVVSVQPYVHRGQLYRVVDLIVDGPPAPGPKGVYWRANPVSGASGVNCTCTDKDTARFEWVLLESDILDLTMQIPLMLAIGVRPAYIIDSGKKSMQAAVRVNATDEATYRARSERLLHGLAAIGFDAAVTNSSRLRRLPGATRPDGRDGPETVQRLVYLDPDAPVMEIEDIDVVVNRVRRKLESSLILSIDDIVYDPARMAPEIVEGILSGNSLAVMYGAPGCGKSFIAMEISLHVATGDVWRQEIDPRRTVKGPVLYIALEGKDGATKRVAALRSRYNVPAGTPWFLCTSRMNLQSETCAKETIKLAEEVKARCGEFPVLIVIDTLARAIGGNENDFECMGTALDHLGQVQDRTAACVWAVHHSGKDAARGARGHSSLIGAADTMIEVAKGDQGVITAELVKQKDDGPCQPLVFRLQQVEVGPGQYADRPATTCLLEHLPPAEGNAVARAQNAARNQGAQRDAQRYEQWLELLPQRSQRAWSIAAGVGESTMRLVIERMAHRGVVRHRVGEGRVIELAPQPVELLPET